MSVLLFSIKNVSFSFAQRLVLDAVISLGAVCLGIGLGIVIVLLVIQFSVILFNCLPGRVVNDGSLPLVHLGKGRNDGRKYDEENHKTENGHYDRNNSVIYHAHDITPLHKYNTIINLRIM